MVRTRPPIIIDIEASGFGAHSYPIEVGVALNDGTKFCSLIRPEPEWTHWDESAERVHRVARDVLETHGRPIADVAKTLNDLLHARIAFSDGWVVDKTWLDRLFFAARMERTFDLSALEMILSESQMEIWHETKVAVLNELGDRRHRASFDAFVIQQTYERTWQLANGPRDPAGTPVS
ncbi:MAG: hypothetical protein JNL33_07015 [Betaproteobacteria bacterium]|nr:hypothetical protein [Betaproteobacteria bacterium]